MKNQLEFVLFTTILCVYLQFGGILPLSFKVISDILLSSLTLLVLRRITLPNTFFWIIVFLFIFDFFVITRHVVHWGEIFLTFNQYRRWFFLKILLIICFAHFRFSEIQIIRILGFISFFCGLIFVMVEYGIKVPNIAFAMGAHGETIVKKVFVFGSLSLFILQYYCFYIFFYDRNKIGFFFLILLFIFCYEFVNFRGYFLGAILSTLLTLIIINLKKSNIFVLSIILVFFICGIYLLSSNMSLLFDLGDTEISDISDIYKIDTDLIYRYENDIVKLDYLFDKGYQYNGMGFIHTKSQAAKSIGFSTETNDTGFVEVLLTEGLLGLLSYSVLFIYLFVYTLKKWRKEKKVISLTLMTTIIFFFLLMFTSNPFFYEFGFVFLGLFLTYDRLKVSKV